MSEKKPAKTGGSGGEKKPLMGEMSGSSAGVDLAASIVVGLGLGYLCQRFLPATRPWGFLGFLFLGIASGFWQLFKTQGDGRKEKK